MKSKSASGGLVYSTDLGRMCPTCRHALAACQCKVLRAAALLAGVGGAGAMAGMGGAARSATVWRETKGRAGKVATVVKGLALDPPALAALGKQLRAACGSGGTVKDGVIELQGDHADRILAALRAQGFAVKRAGG